MRLSATWSVKFENTIRFVVSFFGRLASINVFPFHQEQTAGRPGHGSSGIGGAGGLQMGNDHDDKHGGGCCSSCVIL
jgi:hypothetical protein